MKSAVYAFLRNPSMVDYPGYLAAVFFVRGCNFSCGFCHNAGLMGSPGPGMDRGKLEDACRRFAEEWVEAAVITGGEPTLSDQLPGLIVFLKGYGWKIKLDTNGSRPDMLARCLPLLDYVAMDVKTGPEGYPSLTGFTDMDALRRSIAMIKAEARDYEFRTTVIEDVHDDEQVKGMLPLIAGAKRYVLQPFVPSADLPLESYRGRSRTSYGFMARVAERFNGVADEVLVRGE